MNYHDRAIADISAAKIIMSPSGNPTNDEALYDIAAYHVQQSIEKELKHILHDILGFSDETHAFRTHNIEFLIDIIDENCNYAVPEEIRNIAPMLTEWEANTRYDYSAAANKNDINNAIEYCELFFRDIQKHINSKTMIVLESDEQDISIPSFDDLDDYDEYDDLER